MWVWGMGGKVSAQKISRTLRCHPSPSRETSALLFPQELLQLSIDKDHRVVCFAEDIQDSIWKNSGYRVYRQPMHARALVDLIAANSALVVKYLELCIRDGRYDGGLLKLLVNLYIDILYARNPQCKSPAPVLELLRKADDDFSPVPPTPPAPQPRAQDNMATCAC